MKKMKKKLATLVGGLVVIVIAVLLIVAVAIDSIARKGIESGASYALAVPTTLDRADVGIFSGTFSMSGLTVANPEGFDTPHFLRMGSGGVEVSLGSLKGEVIELPSLTLDGIDLNLQKAGNKSNYAVILENLKRFESDDPKDADPKAEEGGKRFVIDRVEVTNVTVHAAILPGIGKPTTVDVVIPSIVLTDIGTGGEQRGVKLGEAASIIVKAVLATAANIGGNILPKEITSELQNGLSQLSSLGDMGVEVVSEIGNVVGGLGEGVEDIGQGIGEAAEDIGKGLKNLFGGDKEEEDDGGG